MLKHGFVFPGCSHHKHYFFILWDQKNSDLSLERVLLKSDPNCEQEEEDEQMDKLVERQSDRQGVIASPHHFNIIAKGNETQKERNNIKDKRRNKTQRGGRGEGRGVSSELRADSCSL